MKSEISNVKQTWDDRCRAMREDLEDRAYNWLFFKIVINRIDAVHDNDYERSVLLRQMEGQIRNGEIGSLQESLETLEAL